MMTVRVLYIDDEPSLLELGKDFLEGQNGFAVTTAISAHEGLAKLREGSYDAVIADYQMPQMNGIELLKRVRSDYGDLPFILFTGKGREEVVIEAINNGADFYLQKGGMPKAQFHELAHKVRQAVTRRQAELALQMKTEEMESFFSLTLDLLCIADVDGRFHRLNRAWETVLGYKTEELEGKRFLDLVHPEDIAATREAMRRLSGGSEVLDFVNRYRRKDGTYRWIEWRSAPYHDKLIYAAARDITERKTAEEELRAAYEQISANDMELRLQYQELRDSKEKAEAANKRLKEQGKALKRKLEEIAETQKELASSERNFRLLVENSPDAIYLQTNCRFVYLNPAAVRLFGAESAKQLLGTSTWDRIHPSLHAIIQERVRSLTLEAQPVETLEEVYLRMDGTPVPVEVNAVPFTYQGERGAQVIVRDISERKKAEEALRRITRLDAESLRLANMGHWEYDVLADRFTFNDQYYRLHGLTAEQAGGYTMTAQKYAHDFVHPADAHLVKKAIDAAVSARDPGFEMRVDARLLHADGVPRHVIVWFRIEKDQEGRTIRMFGADQDISQAKRAELELKQAILVIENSPVVAFRWRASEGWPVEFVSRNIEQYGYTEEEFLSGAVRYSAIVHPQDLERVAGEVKDQMASGAERFQQEYRILAKDGTVHWVDDRTLVVRDQDGAITHFEGTVLDITERRKAEDALRQVNSKLNILNSITRHDILNKITILLGNLDLAGEATADPQVQDYLRKMRRIVDSIKGHIEFTRIYQDLGVKEPQWQDLGRVITRAQVPEEVGFESQADGFEVYADPMLEKVFENLLDNSLRHGNVKAVRLHAAPSEGGLAIVWEDDGIGIPEGEKEKIFERGYGKNTGLGLFTSMEILAITGITIRENGTEGQRARFEMTVPKGNYRRREGG